MVRGEQVAGLLQNDSMAAGIVAMSQALMLGMILKWASSAEGATGAMNHDPNGAEDPGPDGALYALGSGLLSPDVFKEVPKDQPTITATIKVRDGGQINQPVAVQR